MLSSCPQPDYPSDPSRADEKELRLIYFVRRLFDSFSHNEQIVFYHFVADINTSETALSLGQTSYEVMVTKIDTLTRAQILVKNLFEKELTEEEVEDLRSFYHHMVLSGKCEDHNDNSCEEHGVSCVTVWTIREMFENREKTEEVMGACSK